MNNISINCHSSIKIRSNQVIYFDPFKIETNLNDADIIFLTHDHYDHMSTLDIKKVIKDDTVLVAPESCVSKLKDINNRIISVCQIVFMI